MSPRLRLRFFAHSWQSDWNHGNAHFLRGLVDQLRKNGHDLRCYEPRNSWSLVNLLQEPQAHQSLAEFRRSFPDLDVRTYSPQTFTEFAESELRDADVVVVHEWNSPQIVETILDIRNKYRFRALFHDTHHRSYTSAAEIRRLRPWDFDGVLAFGEAIRRIYRDALGVPRCWTFHEAADTDRFFPRDKNESAEVNWIGNWGDEERTRELHEFLIGPLSALPHSRAAVYGVRYPIHAKSCLQEAGIEYRGYLPNLSTPDIYSRSALTIHIPRRCYSNGLSGIPTIRMFEAFACGVPLVCSPWSDTEGLFSPGEDFITVPDGHAMREEIAHLLRDERSRDQLSVQALKTIRNRHTCVHRAALFEEICGELQR